MTTDIENLCKTLPMLARDDHRHILLKAAVRAHTGDSKLLRTKLGDDLKLPSLAGWMNGFVAFDKTETMRVIQQLGLTESYLMGRTNVFGDLIREGGEPVPSFLVKGSADVAARLRELLQRWPEASTPEALLVTLTQGAIESAEEAQAILAGAKPMGLMAIHRVLQSFKDRGAKPEPTAKNLLAVHEPLVRFAFVEMPKTIQSAVQEAHMQQEATAKQAHVTGGTQTDQERICSACTAWCGTHQPNSNWEDLGFDAEIDNLYLRVKQNSTRPFSPPEISRLKMKLGLTEGYFFKNTETLVGTPLTKGVAAVPVFFLRGDQSVGHRLLMVMRKFAPDMEPAEALQKIVGAELKDIHRAGFVMLGREPLSRRGLMAVVNAWNRRLPDHRLEEKYFFDGSMLPPRVSFGQTWPPADKVGAAAAAPVKQPEAKPAPVNGPFAALANMVTKPAAPAVTDTPVQAGTDTANHKEPKVPDTAPANAALKTAAVKAPESSADETAAMDVLVRFADNNRERFTKLAKGLMDKHDVKYKRFTEQVNALGSNAGSALVHNLSTGRTYWDKLRVQALLNVLRLKAIRLQTVLVELGIDLKVEKPVERRKTHGAGKQPNGGTDVPAKDAVDVTADAATETATEAPEDDMEAPEATALQPEAEAKQAEVPDVEEVTADAATETAAEKPEAVAEAPVADVPVVAAPAVEPVVQATAPQARSSTLVDDMRLLVKRMVDEKLSVTPEGDQMKVLAKLIKIISEA